jgi:hypothetical protein
MELLQLHGKRGGQTAFDSDSIVCIIKDSFFREMFGEPFEVYEAANSIRNRRRIKRPIFIERSFIYKVVGRKELTVPKEYRLDW